MHDRFIHVFPTPPPASVDEVLVVPHGQGVRPHAAGHLALLGVAVAAMVAGLEALVLHQRGHGRREVPRGPATPLGARGRPGPGAGAGGGEGAGEAGRGSPPLRARAGAGEAGRGSRRCRREREGRSRAPSRRRGQPAQGRAAAAPCRG